jgi:hypothetical protein
MLWQDKSRQGRWTRVSIESKYPLQVNLFSVEECRSGAPTVSVSRTHHSLMVKIWFKVKNIGVMKSCAL